MAQNQLRRPPLALLLEQPLEEAVDVGTVLGTNGNHNPWLVPALKKYRLVETRSGAGENAVQAHKK